MAGYGSQTDYEADLLQTYLRRGRVSPVAKRDVELALSIYRLPKSKTPYEKQQKLSYALAKKTAKGKDDSTLMRMAAVSVLNKNIADKKAAKAAKAAPKPSSGTAPSPTGSAPRPAPVIPPAPRPSAPVYSGPLTPGSGYIPPTKTMNPYVPKAPAPSYKPRSPSTYRPRTGITPR